MKKRKRNKKKFKKINILNIINLIFITIFLVLLVKINIIPKNYMLIITGVLTLLELLAIILTNLKFKVLKVIGIILSLLTIIGSIIGSYFVYNGNEFLNNSFNNTKSTSYITYYVVTYAGNDASNRNNIDDVIYYVNNDTKINKAIKELKKTVDVTVTETTDIVSLFTSISNKELKYALVNSSTYEILFDNSVSLNEDNFKIIYQYKIKVKNKVETSSTNEDKFNIYISGTDFANLSDFNMIMTVNINDHKILLTSIPRDYYIPVYGTDGIKDNLSFIGVNDLNTRLKSIEEYFGITFDYYLKIDTNSLVEIVDAVGGIDYCSDVSFTTTHSAILNSYDDSKGQKLTIKKGCQHLNGVQTLTVARERNAFDGRDRQRQKNCQAIIVDIFEQLKSVNTITNYNNILSAVSDSYETNISRTIIEKVMKDTIDGESWTFESQSVDGEDAQDLVHLNSMTSWVMYPYEETIKSAVNKINEVLK